TSKEKRQSFLQERWGWMVKEFQESLIKLTEGDVAIPSLKTSFEGGMVPLFHLSAKSGKCFMNKTLVIGAIDKSRSSAKFLELTKAALAKGHNHALQSIRSAIGEA